MSEAPKVISIKDVLNSCAKRLGLIQANVDQFETVILPIREVQQNLRALANAVWESGDPVETMPEDFKHQLEAMKETPVPAKESPME